MALARVLIKFISPDHAGNVISALAVEPEILIPAGYGEVLTDTIRKRYNHFFHLRGIETVVAEPVSFERNLPADIEGKLERLLAKYESGSPIVDIADADPKETMALGTVLANHQYWGAAVLDYDLRNSIFIPVRNAAHLRRLRFPLLGEADYRFLRGAEVGGRTGMITYLPEEGDMTRAQLDHAAAERIRALGRLYAEAPVFWRDVVSRLSFATRNANPAKIEFVLDANSVGIRDSAFEDLRDIGVLAVFERKAGVMRMKFANEDAKRLFFNMERIPCANVFLMCAQVREFGKNAAFRDLTMHAFTYVTCFYRCLPHVLAVYDENEGVRQIADFELMAYRLYGDVARKILVRYGRSALPEEISEAADHYGVEIIPVRRLKGELEPK